MLPDWAQRGDRSCMTCARGACFLRHSWIYAPNYHKRNTHWTVHWIKWIQLNYRLKEKAVTAANPRGEGKILPLRTRAILYSIFSRTNDECVRIRMAEYLRIFVSRNVSFITAFHEHFLNRTALWHPVCLRHAEYILQKPSIILLPPLPLFFF